MRTWTLLITLILLLGVVVGSSAQTESPDDDQSMSADIPFTSEGSLRFFMDVGRFRGPEGFVRLEIYLLLDAQQLTFVEKDGDRIGEITVVAAVFDSLGKPATNRTWVQPISIDGLEQPGDFGAPFREAIRFDLKPGEHRLVLRIDDVHGNKQGVCDVILQLPNFDRSGLVFSDIQVASALVRSAESNSFVKQGWRVMPNITRHYLSGKPLSLYFELYNFVLAEEPSEESFILGYKLLDATGNESKSFPAKRFIKPGESVVKAEFLETTGLAEGPYELRVEAFDGTQREYVRVSRVVYLVSEELPEGLTDLQKDLLRFYADIRYVANDKTLKTYRELEDWPTKMAFLRSFWRGLDKTPGDKINRRLVDHILRMSYAETHFSLGSMRPGSDTDKGRVYVKYGPPDDMEYSTSAAGQKPYEVWVYEKEREYVFIFRDRRGIGLYELVHSTYPGELASPYWRDEFAR